MDQGSGSTNEFNIAVGLVAKTAMLGNAIRLFHFSNQRNIRSERGGCSEQKAWSSQRLLKREKRSRRVTVRELDRKAQNYFSHSRMQVRLDRDNAQYEKPMEKPYQVKHCFPK